MHHIFFLTIFKDFKYFSNVSRKIHYIVNFKFVSASVDSLKQLATTILHDMRHSQGSNLRDFLLPQTPFSNTCI